MAWGGTLAEFKTPLGTIEVELFDADKPVTVQNFMHYIQSGAYSNTFVHRWEPAFVIQGGGFATANRVQTNAAINPVSTFGTITNEYGVGRTFSNTYGTIAMARQSGQTNSATSQWFFNLTNNAFLDQVDGGFTVFGRVVEGTNVLNKFNQSSTNTGIYTLALQAPLNKLPVLSMKPTTLDLVYTDINLLNTRISRTIRGHPQISWQSVSNKINHVEFTTQLPPVWSDLVSTNGNGQLLQIVDSSSSESSRIYRVRIDF